jgi:hypothetical protein
VARCIVRKIRQLGSGADFERRDEYGVVPDIHVTRPRETVFIEVSVVHPQAPSHQAEAKRGALCPIEYRETAKKRKYETLVANSKPSRLIPAVWDTYGASGKGVKEVEGLLIEASGEHYGGTEEKIYVANPKAVREFRESVAVSLQRGNAKALLLGAARARDAPIYHHQFNPNRRRAGYGRRRVAHRPRARNDVAERLVRGALATQVDLPAAANRDVPQHSAEPITTTHQSSLCVQAPNEYRPRTDEPEERLDLTLSLTPCSPTSNEGMDMNITNDITDDINESDWDFSCGPKDNT